ncbi:hypothetical protein GCM10009760_53210 [Kitasatospora kazusensis]|uniref:Uncharacterized protein n=1 Tax=Kitasatospora kazusensis TaxID=407974 RepID=A0ABN3A5K4_9ACTN
MAATRTCTPARRAAAKTPTKTIPALAPVEQPDTTPADPAPAAVDPAVVAALLDQARTDADQLLASVAVVRHRAPPQHHRGLGVAVFEGARRTARSTPADQAGVHLLPYIGGHRE